MDLETKLKEIFRADRESSTIKKIRFCLESHGIYTVKDLKYLEENHITIDLHPVEKKKLLALREQTSLRHALEVIFGKSEERLDSIEKELRDTGICYRVDIPYIDFNCLCGVFNPMDVKKLNRFIKKEFPDQTLFEEESHKHCVQLEAKLTKQLKQMQLLHGDIESKFKARMDKLITIRNLYSAVLSVENKTCGVDAIVSILNDVQKNLLHSIVGGLSVGAICGGVTLLQNLIKYFSDCNLRDEQKQFLKKIIEDLDKELVKDDIRIKSQMKQIANA